MTAVDIIRPHEREKTRSHSTQHTHTPRDRQRERSRSRSRSKSRSQSNVHNHNHNNGHRHHHHQKKRNKKEKKRKTKHKKKKHEHKHSSNGNKHRKRSAHSQQTSPPPSQQSRQSSHNSSSTNSQNSSQKSFDFNFILDSIGNITNNKSNKGNKSKRKSNGTHNYKHDNNENENQALSSSLSLSSPSLEAAQSVPVYQTLQSPTDHNSSPKKYAKTPKASEDEYVSADDSAGTHVTGTALVSSVASVVGPPVIMDDHDSSNHKYNQHFQYNDNDNDNDNDHDHGIVIVDEHRHRDHTTHISKSERTHSNKSSKSSTSTRMKSSNKSKSKSKSKSSSTPKSNRHGHKQRNRSKSKSRSKSTAAAMDIGHEITVILPTDFVGDKHTQTQTQTAHSTHNSTHHKQRKHSSTATKPKHKRHKSSRKKAKKVKKHRKRWFFGTQYTPATKGDLKEHYRIKEIIGTGNFSTVRRGVRKADKLEIAIKIITKTELSDLEAKLIRREIIIQQRMDHINIVKLYDIFETGHHLYLVMELCKRGELFNELMNCTPRGWFSEREASDIIKQIALGLQYMHHKNVIHRDLKLENVLISYIPKKQKKNRSDFIILQNMNDEFEFDPDIKDNNTTLNLKKNTNNSNKGGPARSSFHAKRKRYMSAGGLSPNIMHIIQDNAEADIALDIGSYIANFQQKTTTSTTTSTTTLFPTAMRLSINDANDANDVNADIDHRMTSIKFAAVNDAEEDNRGQQAFDVEDDDDDNASVASMASMTSTASTMSTMSTVSTAATMAMASHQRRHSDYNHSIMKYYSSDAIMNEHEMVIKISDFGCSKYWGPAQSCPASPNNGTSSSAAAVSQYNFKALATNCGTLFYVAPEILDTKPYDKTVDCWSLGVICYVLLCGALPFFSENEMEVADLICQCKYDLGETDKRWRKVSHEAKDLIRHLLTLHTHERLNADEILQHPWITQAENLRTHKRKSVQCNNSLSLYGKKIMQQQHTKAMPAPMRANINMRNGNGNGNGSGHHIANAVAHTLATATTTSATTTQMDDEHDDHDAVLILANAAPSASDRVDTRSYYDSNAVNDADHNNGMHVHIIREHNASSSSKPRTNTNTGTRRGVDNGDGDGDAMTESTAANTDEDNDGQNDNKKSRRVQFMDLLADCSPNQNDSVNVVGHGDGDEAANDGSYEQNINNFRLSVLMTGSTTSLYSDISELDADERT